MLQRKITAELNAWKAEAKKKSLMIRGARQVGKTYIVRRFGESYQSFVELNFIEHPEYKAIFSGDLNPDTLITNISAYIPAAKLIPEQTLILLDEIQECAEALTSLKFWTGDRRYDIIATGSTLGVDFREGNSFPVGFVKTIEMDSLDFEEFLWAIGISHQVIDTLRECYTQRKTVPAALHSRMLQYMKEYMIIGGMPEVVQAFVETRDIKKADEIQRQLYSDYISNIAHYAPAEIKIRTERCYRSIPLQLAKENHKFQYRVVEKGSTATKYETCLDWLEKAYMIIPVHHVSALYFPLNSVQEDDCFRVYPTDIGLLMAAYPFLVKGALLQEQSMEEKPLNLSIGSAKGGLYEALAADLLRKRGYRELYFLKDQKSTREIEFFITNEDGIIPVEIKAGRNKANSLGRILENPLVPYGYKMSSQNVGVSDKRITLPLYMLMFI